MPERLTAAGRALLEKAETVLEAAQDARRTVHDLERITASTSRSMTFQGSVEWLSTLSLSKAQIHGGQFVVPHDVDSRGEPEIGSFFGTGS
ncbi:hypothetical protein JP75_09960 [Devosia riboflavina]|uniref:Uncharacterized protein n=1 Tax=Devosia riboflavina TaxID=46914 RepID=A0A087M2V7_9HYPH|nr:hypothetical protein JP75_09960 [Devosia riboflavina]